MTGGWTRLWIVISILLGALAFLIAYDAHSRGYGEVPYHVGMSDADFWKAARQAPELAECDWATAHAGPPVEGIDWVSCTTKDPVSPALLWALVPGSILLVIGLTIRWIYRGFKTPKP